MTRWRKSSHSADTGQTDCVEIARLPLAVGVRDSKAPEGGHLTLSADDFAALIARVKRDEPPL
ncbi:DUF397 domain-containing protein [Actinomadura craniellae]|uniref:DUF397 domain-containing protein n=1 Tax=Actinomadura craniellae TaxID=2231787 RepID=A0A365H177_9ACTN|nr:DUF397 domain-containing protein [Actinomadura craniellae]RAY12786.1 DUF397 domain-containing protein [Actinomadura craniellae]